MKRLEHVACRERCRRGSGEESDVKGHLVRARSRWDDSIETDVKNRMERDGQD